MLMGFWMLTHRILECRKLEWYKTLKCNLTSHSLSKFFINFNVHWFLLLTNPSSLFEYNPTYCLRILNVVNVLCALWNLNLLNVMWYEYCAKHKCNVLKRKHFCLSCILEHLCLSCIFKIFLRFHLSIMVFFQVLRNFKLHFFSNLL